MNQVRSSSGIAGMGVSGLRHNISKLKGHELYWKWSMSNGRHMMGAMRRTSLRRPISTSSRSRCWGNEYHNANKSNNTTAPIFTPNEDSRARHDNMHRCYAQTAARATTTTPPKEPPRHPPTTLYKRNPSRTLLPRTLLATTTAHTLYWSWYLYDFTTALSIDPAVGYAGLTLAVAMTAAATLYPPSLVHSIRLLEEEGGGEGRVGIGVRTYSLPFVTVSDERKYRIGDVFFAVPRDVTEILVECKGDLSQIDRHVPITAKDRRIPYLLQVDADKDLVLPDHQAAAGGGGGRKDYGSVWFQYLSPSRTIVDSPAAATAAAGRPGATDRFASRSKKGRAMSKADGRRRAGRVHGKKQKKMERIVRRGR